MQAEFEAAREDGRPLLFAAGCLAAAWRQLPHHAEGRLILSNYVVALGLLVPLAGLYFLCAISLVIGQEAPGNDLLKVGGGGLFLTVAHLRAIPALLLLWLALGIAQLHLAWWSLEGDWSRVIKVGALLAAVMVTLFLFMKILLLDASPLLMPAAAFALEVPLILSMARSHARIFADPLARLPSF